MTGNCSSPPPARLVGSVHLPAPTEFDDPSTAKPRPPQWSAIEDNPRATGDLQLNWVAKYFEIN